jgi:hypothetical protein
MEAFFLENPVKAFSGTSVSLWRLLFFLVSGQYQT